MKNTSNSILKRMAPGLVLGFLVLLGLALLGDLNAVSQSLLQFHWQYFLAALGFTLFNYLLRFLKWHYYVRVIGARDLSWLQSLRMFVAGFPLAVTPGKAGEALKSVWLQKHCQVPFGRGMSVVLAERISDGIAVMILSTVGVFAYPQYWPAFAVIFTVLLLVVILSQVRSAALYLLGLGERIGVLRQAMHGLREFYEGSYTLFRPGPAAIAVVLGTISWLGEGIGFYCILLGLGLQPDLSLATTAIFILAFSTAVGAASALPGGLGAAEVSIAGMLTLLLGLDPALASSATLLIRLATLWFGVGLGLLAWTFSTDLLGLASDTLPAGVQNSA
jgi:uncharacterized protein (TIRG00374 family)